VGVVGWVVVEVATLGLGFPGFEGLDSPANLQNGGGGCARGPATAAVRPAVEDEAAWEHHQPGRVG
jgi:hypothetical protein